MEWKTFLRSFVKRLEITYPRVAVDYTIPRNGQKAEPLSREVLPFARFSSPTPRGHLSSDTKILRKYHIDFSYMSH